MEPIKPKELRKISTGQIFAYTKTLAARKDMVPYWRTGIDPNAKPTGLSIGESMNEEFKDAVVSLQKENADLKAKVIRLEAEKAGLIEENQKYLAVLNAPAKPVREDPEDPDMPSADRQNLINKAVAAIIDDQAEGELTTTGLPRVEAIEARCGLADVTGDERKIAMDAIKG